MLTARGLPLIRPGVSSGESGVGVSARHALAHRSHRRNADAFRHDDLRTLDCLWLVRIRIRRANHRRAKSHALLGVGSVLPQEIGYGQLE